MINNFPLRLGKKSVNNIFKMYIKIFMTSARVGYAASLSQRAEGVPTNKQSGRGSELCLLWGGLNIYNISQII